MESVKNETELLSVWRFVNHKVGFRTFMIERMRDDAIACTYNPVYSAYRRLLTKEAHEFNQKNSGCEERGCGFSS